MTELWISPLQVFDGRSLTTNLALQVQDNRVTDSCTKDQVPKSARIQHISGTISPGFVDLQVNGGGGVLLNNTPTAEGMRKIAAAHHELGTVALMPTLISDAPEVMVAAANAAIAAKGEDGIIGLHIEGPHISKTRCGTHDPKYVRDLDDTTISVVASLREHGITVMITVAPEAASPDQIQLLTQMGVIVSLGHTDSTSADMREAFAAGAKSVTHLFNAMSPMVGRAAGAVGAAINSAAYVGIICDGYHVADEMVGLATRARATPDRMFLVSDAMPTVGGPDHFDLYGKKIMLREGKLINEVGGLAGAHVTMAESVERLVSKVGIDPVTALQLGISVPSDLVGLPELSKVVGRSTSDLLILDESCAVNETLAKVLSD